MGSGRFWIRLEFKPQDFWIGVFWKNGIDDPRVTDVWFCLLPCLPIHIHLDTRSTGVGTH
jgi:hypothetical protein